MILPLIVKIVHFCDVRLWRSSRCASLALIPELSDLDVVTVHVKLCHRQRELERLPNSQFLKLPKATKSKRLLCFATKADGRAKLCLHHYM
jgi:hypothetical protein